MRGLALALALALVLAHAGARRAGLQRRALLSAVRNAALWPAAASLLRLQPARANGLVMFPPESLHNRYFLLRAGETAAEASGSIVSNPIATLGPATYLTERGVGQVEAAARALDAAGLEGGTGCWVYYNKASSSQQTALVLQRALGVSTSNMVPDFAWLDPRGVGALEESSLSTLDQLHARDTNDALYRPPLGDDGTPSESLGDLFVRVRNVISILETSYQDVDVVLVSPSSDVLSVLLAAANGKDLRQHAEYALGPAQFAILDLVPRYAAAPEQGLGEPATTAASEPAAAIAAVRADDRADVSSSY